MPYKDPEKQREYQRLWLAQRREAFFSDKSCVDCGRKEDLEIDHVDPKLKINHRVWSWSRQRRETELAKCVVRCVGCHQQKTTTHRESGFLPGSAHPLAALTEDQVHSIREQVGWGASQADMARLFKVQKMTISRIVNRHTWKHV